MLAKVMMKQMAKAGFVGSVIQTSHPQHWSEFENDSTQLVHTHPFGVLTLVPRAPVPSEPAKVLVVECSAADTMVGPILIFRIQHGTTLSIVLADPQDPEVEALVRGFEKEKRIAIAIEHAPDKRHLELVDAPNIRLNWEYLKEQSEPRPYLAFVGFSLNLVRSLARTPETFAVGNLSFDRFEVSVLATEAYKWSAKRIQAGRFTRESFTIFPDPALLAARAKARAARPQRQNKRCSRH